MSKKKTPTEDLSGFEEVLDLVPLGGKKDSSKNKLPRDNNSFELLNFLEHELNRLNRMNQSLELKKDPNEQVKDVQSFVDRQKLYRNELKEELISVMLKKESIFFKNFQYFYNKTINGL